jgi:hypothetical protein
LDGGFELVVQRLATAFKPYEGQAQRFFGPALSGFIGYFVFALFDKLGVRDAAHGGNVKQFVDESLMSHSSPYLLLALFLMSLAFVIGSADGKNVVLTWVIAPFLNLAEHITMLGLGVFLALGAIELVGEVTWSTVLTVFVFSFVLIVLAYVFSTGAGFCQGEFARHFEKLGRRIMIRFLGFALAAGGVVDLVHYSNLHAVPTKLQCPCTSLGDMPAKPLAGNLTQK